MGNQPTNLEAFCVHGKSVPDAECAQDKDATTKGTKSTKEIPPPADKIPYIEGAEYVKSGTNNIGWLIRLNAPEDQRDRLAAKILTGFHDEELRSQLIPGENKFGRNFQPRGIKWWELSITANVKSRF